MNLRALALTILLSCLTLSVNLTDAAIDRMKPSKCSSSLLSMRR